eukprot:CAMPEP_0194033454 /NCGR_PEP_ID=MMETSP0009_2-20130614/6146_1 /TAXON_ID=210454 /ORGANISM="Grammatophora oceanica, Strain CCMP 410" /LENGTH=209 /DNA_ID=CAMNT_0038674153 /DNA_START=72 /DNA_END=701 /DNA_ORIENTATION=+
MTLTLEDVTKISKENGYDPYVLPKLEEYVEASLAGSTPYCHDCNRAVVKLYNFRPDLAKEEIYTQVLTLAMTAYPSTDLLQITSLVPEAVQSTEPASTVLRCAGLLEAAKFSEFWKAYEELPTKPKGSDAQLRAAILGVLALTCREAPLGLVQAAVPGESNVASHTDIVESVTGDKVIFKATENNTKRNRVFSKGVSFSAVTRLTAAAQ